MKVFMGQTSAIFYEAHTVLPKKIGMERRLLGSNNGFSQMKAQNKYHFHKISLIFQLLVKLLCRPKRNNLL